MELKGKLIEIKIKKINQLLIKEFGVPGRELTVPDPLDCLIATILSQNTNDRNSFRAFRNLKSKCPCWDGLANLSRERIEDMIRPAGLAYQKPSAIKSVGMRLSLERGQVSLDFLEEMKSDQILKYLTSFKGVGVKTASCVLLFSLSRNFCPVDTHVHRVLNRLGIVKTISADKTFELINAVLPEGIAHSFHTNIIKVGRRLCRPARPACGACVLYDSCSFEQKDGSNTTLASDSGFLLLDNINKT